MADAPPFDPSRPFKEIGAIAAPTFNPSQPFKEIDANEGSPRAATSEQLRSPLEDFLKSIPRGAVKGFWEAVNSITGEGMPSSSEALEKPGTPGRTAPAQTGEEFAAQFTPALPKPEGVGGKFGSTTGEFLGNPASYLGPGGLLQKGATAVTAALGSEAAGQATEGTKLEPFARVGGAVAGGQVPRTALRTASRAISPFPTSPERQQFAQTLRAEGVEPSAGQVTGSKALKIAESELGDAPGAGGRGTAHTEETGRQFMDAALRRAHLQRQAGEQITDTIHRGFNERGIEFDRLSRGNDATLDRQFAIRILDAQDEYNQLSANSLPAVERTIDHIMQMIARNGTMSGDEYAALRSRMEFQRRAVKNDPQFNIAMSGIRQAMDDAMERSIARNNPGDLGAWREVRNDYRNLLVLERAAAGPGEQAAQGMLTPARLRQSVVAQQGRRDYARGQGDYADLARAGEAILTPLPSSQTAARSWIHAVPAALGAGAGALHGGSAEALGGAFAGALAPGAVGRAIWDPRMQRYLQNQAAVGWGQNITGPGWTALRSGIPAAEALSPGGP